MQPFPAEGLDASLDAETRRFVTDPSRVRLREDGTVELSQSFEWYAEDFEAAGGALAFVRRYRTDLPESAPVVYIPYDWGLIAQEGKGP